MFMTPCKCDAIKYSNSGHKFHQAHDGHNLHSKYLCRYLVDYLVYN